MANKYTKTPNPSKALLELMYHQWIMTQSEIAIEFNTTQKVVFRWFKDLGIKSRIAFKRDQKGSKNNSWKGKNITYAAMHCRVQSIRGKANHCDICGESDPSKRYEWANISENYLDVNDYLQMCCSCHKKHDKIGENFRIKRINKRQLIDAKA